MSLSRKLVRMWLRFRREHDNRFVYDETLINEISNETEYLRIRQALDRKNVDANDAMLLAMRSLSMYDREIRAELASAELCVTFPGGTLSSARPTFQVIREMIENAESDVILAGYRVTNSEVYKLLQKAAQRNVSITLLIGNLDGDADRLMECWPSSCPPPEIYVDVPHENGGLMHIKSIVVDQHELLITSANFTFNAMNKNFEFGIKLAGPHAKQARQVLLELAGSDMFEVHRGL